MTTPTTPTSGTTAIKAPPTEDMRDRLAGAALNGIISTIPLRNYQQDNRMTNERWCAIIADLAYDLADALIAEKLKRPPLA